MSLPDHCHRQVRIHEAGDLLVAMDVAEGDVVEVRVAERARTHHRILAHCQPALGPYLGPEHVAVAEQHGGQVGL